MQKTEISASVGNCSISLGLDRRKEYKDGFNVAIKFVISGKTLYHRTGWRSTVGDFERVMNTSSTRGRRSADRQSDANTLDQWINAFQAYRQRLQELNETTPLSLDSIRVMLDGRSDKANFLTIWMDVVASRSHGTAASYEVAMKSFMKCSGFHEQDGFNVTKDTIHRWVQGMTEEGKAKATIGIYLRSCRVVVNECIRRGLMSQKNYPFGSKDDSLVRIPRGESRRHDFLSVEKMTTLYRVFKVKEYPQEWGEEYNAHTHVCLGVFLMMYLANGLNLADLARLTYNDYYFRSGKRALKFNRQKTKDRTDNSSEVIVPITDELRAIMGELAAPEERDERMFPFILKDATKDKDVARRIQQENQNIKKHIRRISSYLGWLEEPSPTWCRHSFATNLSQAGVPMKYISDAMGHSTGGNVTMGYIAQYPIDTQLKYNKKLLNVQPPRHDLLEALESISDEELAEILSKRSKK